MDTGRETEDPAAAAKHKLRKLVSDFKVGRATKLWSNRSRFEDSDRYGRADCELIRVYHVSQFQAVWGTGQRGGVTSLNGLRNSDECIARKNRGIVPQFLRWLQSALDGLDRRRNEDNSEIP